jgi:hypothetical protein
MMLGELIFSDADPVMTPAVASQGTKVTIMVDVTQESGTSPSLVVALLTKNRDQSTWTTAGSVTLTTTTAGSIDAMILEQICLQYTMGGTNSWMRVFTYDPIWGN